VSLRVCLVTPFSWSQPHEVNDHVRGAADVLRDAGHEVCILAPSNRARDLGAGRRALRRLEEAGEPLAGLVVLGPAIVLPSGSRVSVPVGTRANLKLALTRGGFDIVHGHEPGLASLSYLALRDADALTVATFHSSDRLGYPPGKTQRARLLARIDALTATSEEVAEAAAARFPGDYHVLPAGIDLDLFQPGPKRDRFVLEWDPEDRGVGRAAVRALRALPSYELVTLRARSFQGRPSTPRALRGRVSVVTAPGGEARARILRGAVGFVPSGETSRRALLEARASGVPIVSPPGRKEQPELVAAAMERLAEDASFRDEEATAGLEAAAGHGLEELGRELYHTYSSIVGRRRPRAPYDLLADRPSILADLHMHTEHSHDCSISVAELLDYAEEIGLGAIAVTDHNIFEGAREAAELARGRRLVVIPGEEVMTEGQGEVIGLFLGEEITRGMTMGDTIAAIHEQGGLVYLPHPFDRLHSIPDAATLHRHLPEIDVLEAYNARLLFEGFNDEAQRFARKYNLLAGAGSDAHVLQGVGTGVLRMRAFRTPEEFLISLRSAEIVRRPKSLLYLQSLKWVAQARERRAEARAR
jgi:predicted metal-dependent phosphoesterase TrpH